VRGLAMGIANAGNVHAHELELGAHVGAHKGGIHFTRNVAGRHPRHVVARRHQAKGLLIPGCTFANGIHIVVTGAAGAVDGDTTARADGQYTLAGQLIARTDACGEHDHVGLQIGVVRKLHAVARTCAIRDLLRIAAGVYLYTQLLDLGLEHTPATLIDLHGHQAGRKLDHMGFQAHVAQRLGTLQAQQATAHHHAGLGLGARGLHGLQVLDGAVDEAMLTITPRHLRHEGVGPRGQHQLVVGQDLPTDGGHGAGAPVDGRGTRPEA